MNVAVTTIINGNERQATASSAVFFTRGPVPADADGHRQVQDDESGKGHGGNAWREKKGRNGSAQA